MNTESESIAALFEEWFPLTKAKENPNLVPDKCGSYILRNRAGRFGRLVGESDIVYIGSSGSLNERIISNYLKGIGGETTQRIHFYLVEQGYIDRIDVGFTLLLTIEESERIEKKLLREYEKDHHELPPWNRRE